MFVFDWWKEMYVSGLEMAARNTLSAISPLEGDSGEEKPARLTSSEHSVSTEFENAMLSSLGELAFCLLDKKGQALGFSADWKALTHLEPEQCAGIHFVDFFHPQHRQLLFRKLAELSGHPEEALRFRAQYGSTHVGFRWYEWTLSLRQRKEDASAPVVAVVLRDIAREMETERNLRTAQIEADLALRARAEFLGHMSHELRTPLNAILGFAEMIELGVHGEVEDEHYREYLSNIRESGQMLLGRINDMLEVASIEVGDTEVHDIQLSPETVIEAALQLHRHEAFCRRVTLKAPTVPSSVVIHCDLAKVTRALGNIVANAIRFSKPEGAVEVSVEVTRAGGIAFVVRDVGAGMSADHLAQVQEALERRSGMFNSSPERVCLGLGLMVAKEFAGLHGGCVQIDSEKGKGTEVLLCLPSERVVSLESPRTRKRRQQLKDAV